MPKTVNELLDLATTALLGDAEVLKSVVDDDVLQLGTDPVRSSRGRPLP